MKMIRIYFVRQIKRIRDFLDPTTKYDDWWPGKRDQSSFFALADQAARFVLSGRVLKLILILS